MKKKMTALLITMLMLWLTACSANTKSPEGAVTAFLGAVKQYDFEKAKGYMAPEEAAALDQYNEEMEEQFGKEFVPYLKKNASRLTFRVEETDNKGDWATVTVKCKLIDGSELLTRTMEQLYSEMYQKALSGSAPSDQEISVFTAQALDKQRKAAEEIWVEKTLEIPCVKREENWFIEKADQSIGNVINSNFLESNMTNKDLFSE